MQEITIYIARGIYKEQTDKLKIIEDELYSETKTKIKLLPQIKIAKKILKVNFERFFRIFLKKNLIQKHCICTGLVL
ncbi:MAG: hypothetical protein ACPLWC_03310 [Candidatus Woesearchaeota archaeon]